MKKYLLPIYAFLLSFTIVPLTLVAQFTMMTDFTGNGAFTGSYPYHHQNLISDGTYLYGMTRKGGLDDFGVIFKHLPNGSDYTVLFHFNDTTTGKYPSGGLFFDGEYLYGITNLGGKNNNGTLFRILPDGTGYTKLVDFGAGKGNGPIGPIVSDGVYIYGLTSSGGSWGFGTLYRIRLNGKRFSTLLHFDGVNFGRDPTGYLYYDRLYLYGMTRFGGINHDGTLYKIKRDGSGFTNILQFDHSITGSHPVGSLLSDGVFLYGMTRYGGAHKYGTMYKIKPDGTDYTRLLDFDGVTKGSAPFSSLISDGTFLYGMTSDGGARSDGTIFKIKHDGTEFIKLFDLDDAFGSNPHGSLFFDGTTLYGMAQEGGLYNYGTIFSIQPDGNNFSSLVSFAKGIYGQGPQGPLYYDGTYYYGIAGSGGHAQDGLLYRIKEGDSTHTVLFEFDYNLKLVNPIGFLVSDGTFLYGLTTQGGQYDDGTLYKMNPDGTGFIKLFDFNRAVSGFSPYDGMVIDGTFLYGITAYGGTHGVGNIFRIKSNGTGYFKINQFGDGADGEGPVGALYADNTHLYGMTVRGGSNGVGIMYKIKKDGTGYTRLLDFDAATNGQTATGTFVSDGQFLYGVTQYGGTYGDGTIFKVKPDGTSYTKLLDFDESQNGSAPVGSLVFHEQYLYGVTNAGGTGKDGTLFRIKPDGSKFATLFHFDERYNGKNPGKGLISVGGKLFGTTLNGGAANAGTVFSFSPPDTTRHIQLLIDTQIDSILLRTDAISNIIEISPNPGYGQYSLHTENNLKLSHLQIYNTIGNPIYQSVLFNSASEFDISTQPEGIYFVVIHTDRGLATKKIMLLH